MIVCHFKTHRLLPSCLSSWGTCIINYNDVELLFLSFTVVMAEHKLTLKVHSPTYCTDYTDAVLVKIIHIVPLTGSAVYLDCFGVSCPVLGTSAVKLLNLIALVLLVPKDAFFKKAQQQYLVTQ